MSKNFDKFISKFKNYRYIFAALLVTCFLSYGLTLNMYFWKDDFALMIKAQDPEKPVGFFGAGIRGDGAYRYVATPYDFLYPTFGLNASLYFLVGILLYLTAAVGVFILAKEIFKNRHQAFLTSLIFSSGFIGADSVFGLSNSYQTSWVILCLCLCLTFFLKSFREKNSLYYIFSFFIFAISLETGFIRAHGFFLIIVSTIFLFLYEFSFKKILEFFIKIIPFFLVFKYMYLGSAPAKVGSSQLTSMIAAGNYEYFLNPLATFINVIIPTSFINKSLNIVNQFFGRSINPVKYQSLLFAIFFVSIFGYSAFLFFRKKLTSYYFENQQNLSIVFFSLSSIFAGFIGVFYIGAGNTYLDSTHRYFSTAFVGLSFFWVSILNLVFQNKNKPAPNLKVFLSAFLICIIYIVLCNVYSLESINLRTEPQKQFFSQLKKEMPEIKNKTFLYFDVSNKNNSNGKFGNIFGAGSIGGSGEITMHYPGVYRYDVVTSISDFKDFVIKFNKENGDINNSYWFYFENNKLTNKSDEFRMILKDGMVTPIKFPGELTHQTKFVYEKGKYKAGISAFEFIFPDQITSLTDGILKFDLQIIPSESIDSLPENNSGADNLFLEYLLSKSKIKNQSKAEVLNSFQNQTANYLFDSKPETFWMADRGRWHNLIHGFSDEVQFINVSLENPINLGGILFTNGHTLRTPTAYRILVKENNIWKEIKKIDSGNYRNSGEVWFERVDPTNTGEVRIEILNSSSGDAPQLAEVELVDSRFADIDFKQAAQIELDPSILLEKNPSSALVADYFAQNGKLSFVYKSNKDNGFNVPDINFNIKGLDKTYTYELPIPAGGINLEKGKFFNLNFPAKYIFSNFEFINPPLKYYLDRL